VNLPSTYILSVNYLNSKQDRAKWWNTSIAYQYLGTFIRPVRHEEQPSQEKWWIWHAAAWASSLYFPLSWPGASIYAKQAEILAAKDGTICREGCPVIFHKWPLSRHLGNCFWISEPVLVRNKYFVYVWSTYRLSLPCMLLDHDSCQMMKFLYMRSTCSVAIQNMGLKLELNLRKKLVFILLCLYLICAEYEIETFGSTSDQTRLMAFYLHTDVIDVILKQYIR